MQLKTAETVNEEGRRFTRDSLEAKVKCFPRKSVDLLLGSLWNNIANGVIKVSKPC